MFARKKEFPDYGWSAEIYEGSINDLIEIQKLQKTGDEAGYAKKIVSLIKNWNFTDRDDKPLPLVPESLNAIPKVILKELISAITKPMLDDDLKNSGT